MEGLCPSLSSLTEKVFFNFQVKNAGFYAILLRKTMLAARNWDRSVA